MSVTKSAISAPPASSCSAASWGGSIGTAATALASFITVGASDTIMIVGVQYQQATTATYTLHWDSTGTNQLMTQISGTAALNATGTTGVVLFGLVNPTPGAKTLSISNSSTTLNTYLFGISFTGSGTSSVASVCYGANTSTAASGATNALTTSASVASTDAVVAIYGVASSGGFNVNSSDITGGTWIGSCTALSDNYTSGYGSGAGATYTMTGNSTASTAWSAAIVAIAAPAAAGPPNNQDYWPNPSPTPYWLGYNWSESGNDFPPFQNISKPTLQSDWPVPRAAARLQDYFWSEGIQPSVPVSTFQSQYRPNPQPITWYQSWTVNLLQTTLAPIIQNPFFQTNWPTPQSTVWYRDWFQALALNLPINNQTIVIPGDFGYPRTIDWYQNWNLNLLQSTLLPSFQAPFAQYDWPLPRTYTPIQQFWAEPGNVQLPFPTPFFQVVDSPLPVVPQPIDQTWIQSLNNFFQSETFPFSQKDWPLPYPIQWYKDWYQALALYLPTIIPFNQEDWPNPRTYPPIDQFWSNNLNLLPQVSTTKPFNQSDWPNPRDYQRIDESFWQNIINLFPPPPPPAAPTASGKTWTKEEWTKKLTEYVRQRQNLSMLGKYAAQARWKK